MSNEKYPMPVLTEAQHEDAEGAAKRLLRARNLYANDLHDVQLLAQIALASLTNDGQDLARKVWSDLDRMASPEPYMRKAYESVMQHYTAPPVPVMKAVELNKGALMISAYATDPMNEDPVLCLSKDGVIEAIRAAGGEVKE